MIALIAVYRPGFELVTLVTALREAAPGAHVVVVDDGTGPAAAAVLDEVRRFGGTVECHPANRGKGVALKTGLRLAAEAHPGDEVVCADADGQHRVPDILRVAERARVTGGIALGVRGFEGAVPLRSRIGNTATRLLFRAATGRAVRDTQTGLRAYPAPLLPWLLTVPGERFEYEMNVLLHAAREGYEISEVPVATTYVDGNAGSHFGSLADSARVCATLLRHAVT